MTHSHLPSSYWSRRHAESVLLDIGDDVGALVLYVDADLHQREIEVCPLGVEAQRTHSAVLERACNGRVVYAAVYPELPGGEYEVCWGDAPRFSITPGAVTELRLE